MFAEQSIAILSCMVQAALEAAFLSKNVCGMEKNRVVFYVDGFNFYYGLKRKKEADIKWKRFYWIDMVKLFEQFLGPDQVLERVIYFTASPLNPDKSSRQSAFLNANKILHPDQVTMFVIQMKNALRGLSAPAAWQTPEKFFI